MSRMIQIRNVPDALHRELKVRAAQLGMTLSDYLTRIAREAVERPTPEEMRQRLAARAPVHPSLSTAMAVREERRAR